MRRCFLLLITCTSLVGFTELEEVVSSAPNLCGPWALPHRASYGCEYPITKAEHRDIIGELRMPLFDACLICEAQVCRFRSLSMEDHATCELVFATPERILSFPTDILFADRSFDATFTYAIDPKGRITELSLIESRGMSNANALKLIRMGANQLRYRPLVRNGMSYSIADLEGAYVMQVASE